MTENNVQAVGSYTFSHRDKLFLDTNVWLYLFGPRQPRNHWNQIYSQVFNRILNANSQIYIDVLVVSEFINAYARMKQKVVAPYINNFKVFRGSLYFKPVVEDIADDVELVLSYCSKTESGFTALPMDDLIADYISGVFDFKTKL